MLLVGGYMGESILCDSYVIDVNKMQGEQVIKNHNFRTAYSSLAIQVTDGVACALLLDSNH